MPTMNIIQSVRQALNEEMKRDENVIVLGEDVGVAGGVFGVTEGLYAQFGPNRVIDTPLSENGIVGFAIGAALYGMRPVAEIQFADFIHLAFDQIVNNASHMCYRSAGSYHVPMVIRSPHGGGVRGGLEHSQSPEALFLNVPGIKIVIPSTPYDAKGLLKSAVRDENPVIFFEHKGLYRAITGDVPLDEYTIPIGVAKVLREGRDISIFAWGAMAHLAQRAVAILEREGIDADLIDLRTVLPLDREAILNSGKKTGRVVIVHEAPKTGGVGAEISAILAEQAMDSMKVPILRVCGYDSPFPYALEQYYMPSEQRILEAVHSAMSY
jgi:pyruvate/2-oxoglutarate/acetoin dehydrogenase E1 component